MKKKWRTISMLLFIVAFFLIVSSFKNITGLAILDTTKPIVPVFGIFILIIAIAVYGVSMMAAPVTEAIEKRRKTLEELAFEEKADKISVSYSGGHVYLNDPTGILTTSGRVSAEELPELIAVYDKQVQTAIKHTIANRLYDIEKKGALSERIAAGKILKTLGLSKSTEEERRVNMEREIKDSRLLQPEAREVHNTFRTYRGVFDDHMRAIFRRYGLQVTYEGKHYKVAIATSPKHFITITCTPSKPCGDIIATKLIHAIHSYREEEVRKKYEPEKKDETII